MHTRMRPKILVSVAVGAALVTSLTACGGVGGPSSDQGQGGAVPDDRSDPTTEVVQITDPVHQAFTVEVPAGWNNLAYTTGEFGNYRYTASSVSPDGQTVLTIGDPGLPSYFHPDYANPVVVQFDEMLNFIEISPYIPAAQYYFDYVVDTFGALPEFEIISQEELPGTMQGVVQQFIDAGLQPPQVEAIETRYTYVADGESMNALLVGVSVFNGSGWTVDVSGMTTEREIDDYRPMLVAMTRSLQIRPEWNDQLNQMQQQQMAQIEAFGQQLTAQHNANMAWIQSSAAAHQSRMEAIWAVGDASMQSYYERMDSMDVSQQSFLNYINDESTVQNTSGQLSQVQSGYSQYYQNPADGSYIGTSGPLTDQQLYEHLTALGHNPNGWEAVEVVR